MSLYLDDFQNVCKWDLHHYPMKALRVQHCVEPVIVQDTAVRSSLVFPLPLNSKLAFRVAAVIGFARLSHCNTVNTDLANIPNP